MNADTLLLLLPELDTFVGRFAGCFAQREQQAIFTR